MAEGGLGGEVREYGRIANTPAALERLARKLDRDGVRLRLCYEAGPCGYGIQRQLSAHEHEGVVVAPSLIPSASITPSSAARAAGTVSPSAASPRSCAPRHRPTGPANRPK